jgi:cephalosporin-C deacetylase
MPIFDMPIGELRTYRPPLTRKDDFDAFWRETLAQIRQAPIEATFTPVDDYPLRNATLYDVRYTGWDGARIGGWYIRPAGAEPALRSPRPQGVGSLSKGPFPAVVVYHGYSGFRSEPHVHFAWTLQGYAVLAVDVRGQSGDTADTSVYPGGHTWGWMTQGILDRQSYYYRGVYADCVRALDALATREEVDMARVAVTGVSQGGGLTLAVAGLDPRPVAAMADIPFLCHFERAVDLAEVNPYLEISGYIRQYPQHERRVFDTLTYFDGMNLAPHIRCPTLMSVGLVDKCCPPSTAFATYNHLQCVKELAVYRYNEHADIPPHFRRKLAWAAWYLTG